MRVTGTARTMTSAHDAAAETCPFFAGRTSYPARVKPFCNALPTLPAPMIAIFCFMVCSPDPRRRLFFAYRCGTAARSDMRAAVGLLKRIPLITTKEVTAMGDSAREMARAIVHSDD